MRTGEPANDRRGANIDTSIMLRVHAHVIAPARQWRCGSGSIDELAVQVLVFEDFAETLGAPVRDEELQPSLRALPPVAVVAEDADDAGPDIGHLLKGDEGAETHGEVRVRRQAAADPDIEAGAELWVHHADERQVVDLVSDVLPRRSAHRALELPRQVREGRVQEVAIEDLLDCPGAVDDLVDRDPGDRGAEDDAGHIAAGLRGAETDRFEPVPDLGNILDADPVELDVLPVGDVGGVAGELGGDLGDRAQLAEVKSAAVRSHPHHEVLVLELLRLQGRGLAAVDPWLALRVETPPAKPSAQVIAGYRVESADGVDALDPGPNVEPVVVLLHAFIGIERLPIAEAPLAVRLLGPGRARGVRDYSGHQGSLGLKRAWGRGRAEPSR